MPSSHSGSSHSSSSHSSSSRSSSSRSSGSSSRSYSSSSSRSYSSSRSSGSSGGSFFRSSGGPSSHSSSSNSSLWGTSRRSRGSWGSSSDYDSSRNSSATRSQDYNGMQGALWGLSASARDASRGPSPHSESSRSSQVVTRSHFVRSGSMRGTVIDRARTNQPQGYMSGAHHNAAPVSHFCLRHNYLYYPYDWTDEATGQAYEKGYYDEDGHHYEDVVFLEDGKYKNVLCQCEYCDTVTKLDWTEGGPLICPQCGGTMKILSALDEYTQDPHYNEARQQAGYVDYADRNLSSARVPATASSSRRGRTVLIVSIILVLAAAVLALFLALRNRSSNGGGGGLSNPERFGDTIYLIRGASGGYQIATGSLYEKKLTWDKSEDCYYDDETGLWLWYNTDVDPALWQYWYEPISGDYGDYGWMEYENGVWYIETSAGSWSRVPQKYDTSGLWYIESKLSQAGDSSDQDLPIVIDPAEAPSTEAVTEHAPYGGADSNEDLAG